MLEQKIAVGIYALTAVTLAVFIGNNIYDIMRLCSM